MSAADELRNAVYGSQNGKVEFERDDVYVIPTYPVEVLPSVMQALVARGRADGLPVALVAGAALGAVAGAIGTHSEIVVTDTLRERAIIWPALIAPRGAGKSPAHALAFRALRQHDAVYPDDAILLSDVTIEALARAMFNADGAITLDVDELAQLLRGMGEYKGGGGGDRGRLLKLWDGGSWPYQRVGTGKTQNATKLHIPAPTLVVCGTLQPALHMLLGGEEDGFRPRWLPHLAALPEDVGDLRAGEAPASWTAQIDLLIGCRRQERTWTLSPAGLFAFNAWRRRWKDRARRGMETAGVSAALEKGDRHLARVALVLAEAENSGRGGEVDSELIDRAGHVVEFTIDCWRALPELGGLGLTRRDEKLDRATDRLRDWLEQHGGMASRRELQRARVASVRKASDLDALLQTYEETYPGTVAEVMPPGGGQPTLMVRAPRRRVPGP